MPKKETITLVIILILINIISIGAFMFLFNFTKNQIDESVNRENDLKVELKREETMVLMKDDLILGQMYQTKLFSYMIPSEGNKDFIKLIEQIVLNSGLKSDINSITNEPYDKGSSIGTELVRVKMNVMGEWKNIQFFLKTLENYPLKVDINKVSINKSSDFVVKGKTVPLWSGNFEFTVVKVKDIK